jgi:hypothetical protein
MPRVTIYAFVALLFMAGLAAEARASLIITTPAGIAPGKSFIVTFIDDATPTAHAESTSISTYDTAVTSAAANFSYTGGTIGSWEIIGATAATNQAAALWATTLPIYNDKGTLVGANGSAYLASGYSPNYDQNGSGAAGRPTWTGLQGEYANGPGVPGGENGQPAVGYTLGSSYVESGNSNQEYSLGGLDGNMDVLNSLSGNLYGWAIFTAASPTPEPGTLTLSLLGFGAVGVVRLTRRRRGARQSA